MKISKVVNTKPVGIAVLLNFLNMVWINFWIIYSVWCSYYFFFRNHNLIEPLITYRDQDRCLYCWLQNVLFGCLAIWKIWETDPFQGLPCGCNLQGLGRHIAEFFQITFCNKIFFYQWKTANLFILFLVLFFFL